MNIHYTGQTKCARKMMIDYYHLNAEDVAMMSDTEIREKIEKDFIALEIQNDNNYGTDCESIFLIKRDKFDDVVDYTLER